ncbi:Cap-specific mRNA (nucleoside-2'-O-)-methyltransferase 2 [Plasmodiophora brassicae]
MTDAKKGVAGGTAAPDLWVEEVALLAAYARARARQPANAASPQPVVRVAPVSTTASKPSIEEVAKALQSQNQKTKASAHPPKHRPKRMKIAVTAETTAPRPDVHGETISSNPYETLSFPKSLQSASVSLSGIPKRPRDSGLLPSLEKAMHIFDSDGSLFKKRVPLPSSVGAALDPSWIMSVKSRHMDELDQAKSDLCATKNQLDPLVAKFGRDSWSQHTAALNPSGLVVRQLRQAAHIEMGTNAWTKLFEIVAQFPDSIPSTAVRRGQIRSLHLCEAPGAFVCALNHYVRTQFPDVVFNWYASSLNPYHDANENVWMVRDDKFIKKTRQHWLFGADDTGQMMDINNIRDIWRRVGANEESLVDIVTADGSLDSIAQPNEEETVSLPLIYAEVVCALGCLNLGGTLIFKVFSLLESQSISLVYLISALFGSVDVVKPMTSRPANGELYVVARDYRGAPATLLDRLCHFVSDPSSFPVDLAIVDYEHIPSDFVDQAVSAALYFQKFQIEAIDANVAHFHKMSQQERDDFQGARWKVAHQFLADFNVKPLPPTSRLIHDEYVDGTRGASIPTSHHGNNPVHGRGTTDAAVLHYLHPGDERSGSVRGKRPRQAEATTPVEMSPASSSPMIPTPSSVSSGESPSPNVSRSYMVKCPAMADRLEEIAFNLMNAPFDTVAQRLQGSALRESDLSVISASSYCMTWLPAAPLSFLFILAEGSFIFPLDRSSAPIRVQELEFPRRKKGGFVDQTIACGHLVCDVDAQDKIDRFLITDVLVFEGHHLVSEALQLRLEIARVELINPLKQRALDAGQKPPLSLRAMPVFSLEQIAPLQSILKSVTHDTRGIVLLRTAKRTGADSVARYTVDIAGRSSAPSSETFPEDALFAAIRTLTKHA